jgi:hypothetical protein
LETVAQPRYSARRPRRAKPGAAARQRFATVHGDGSGASILALVRDAGDAGRGVGRVRNPVTECVRRDDLIVQSDGGGAAGPAGLPALRDDVPRQTKVTVVIPAINEADNLPFILPLLPEFVTEVILVDGGSSDDTVEVARAIRPGVRVIGQTGTGKGDALARGFDAVSGDVIVMLDADGSADPSEIPRFLAALDDGTQFAKGTRFLRPGGSQDITRLRRFGNAVLTRLVNLLFHTRYTDLCYGYNVFRAECLPYLDLDCDGFEIEALINVRLAKAHLRVVEVPSFEHARISGVSNLKAFRDGRRVLRTILRERFRRSPDVIELPVGDDDEGADEQVSSSAPAVALDLTDVRGGDASRRGDEASSPGNAVLGPGSVKVEMP